jgi:lipid II:glycine glycyltransferase (peptidoglycan interpeptide bridge formation enzyme)
VSTPLEPVTIVPPEGAAAREVSRFLRGRDWAHFQQDPLWASLDTEVPDARYRLGVLRSAGRIVGSALVRVRRIGRSPVRIAEIAGGPVATTAAGFQALLEAVAADAAASGVARIEARPYLPADQATEEGAALERAGFDAPLVPASPATLVVSLEPEEEALLASFRKGTRQEIRRAQEAGLTVRKVAGEAEVAAFQAIYDAMEAKGATPRPAPFFARVARALEEDAERGFFLVALHEGVLLGGAVILLQGRGALYGFGAAERGTGRVACGHHVQYAAMCEARRRGALHYDLGGFTEGAGEEGARTPVQRVNLWKQGFRGAVCPLLPPRARVVRPWLHAAEGAARRLLGRE